MEVSVESTSTLERKLTVGVPAADVNGKVDAKIKETQKQASLPGFRPGKVPFKEIRRRFGAGIRQEVLEEVLQKAYPEALEQADLRPVAQPEIAFTSNQPGKDVEFVATLEVYPEIQVEGLDKIEAERVITEINDADVDELIEQLRSQKAEWAEKEEGAAAEEGDQLTLDYAGSIDGEAFEGGTAEGQTLELGSKSMIPGFEDQLVGVKQGEERVLSVTFPDDYSAEALQGKEAEFKATVHKIESKELPALDDEFFEAFGVKEGGETAFRENVTTNMERQRTAQQDQILSHNIMVELGKYNPIEVPQTLIQREASNLREKALEQIFGQIPEQLKNNMDLMPLTGFLPQAEHNVRSGLLLVEVISSQDMKATPEQVEAKLEEMAASYDEPEQMIQYYKSNEEAMRQIEQQVLESLVIEYIASQGTVTESRMSFKALMEYKLEEPKASAAESEEAESSAEEGSEASS